MISLYFGNIGSGKTTILAYYASKAKKLGYKRVYSNIELKDAIRIKSSDIGDYAFSDSLILLDEGGIDFNNRFYKGMKQETIQYLKLSRHYGADIVIVSQSPDDIDITFRRLVSNVFYVRRITPHITMAREYLRLVGLDEITKDFITQYEPKSIFRKGVRFFFMPIYWKFFDSFSRPELPEYPV